MNIERIPIPDLPSELLDAAAAAVTPFSLSMVISDDKPASQLPCAGVLVAIADKRGILTARHVAEQMKKHMSLYLLMGLQRYRIATQVLVPCYPPVSGAANPWKAEVPDIAFVPLSSTDIGRLEASGKAFYSIGRRSNEPGFDVHGEDGFFLVVGNPQAMAKYETGQLVQLRFATDIGERLEIGEWDYVPINLDIEDHHLIPEDQHGMSGGGLWRAKLLLGPKAGEFKLLSSRDVTLSGLVFLQTSLVGRQLIAHGSKSIYDSMKAFVAEGDDG